MGEAKRANQVKNMSTENLNQGLNDSGGATGSAQSVPQTKVFFYKTLVNMQVIRDNPPFFSTYYLRGHKKARIGDKLYIKTPWGYESANMVVAGFSRGAVRPAPAGE